MNTTVQLSMTSPKMHLISDRGNSYSHGCRSSSGVEVRPQQCGMLVITKRVDIAAHEREMVLKSHNTRFEKNVCILAISGSMATHCSHS